jgi:hypothetical protein
MAAAAPATAQRGAPAGLVLERPATAEFVAVGGTAAATARDETALFANPAGLAAITGAGAGGSWQPYIADARLVAAAVGATALGGGIAVGIRSLDYGDIDEIVPDPGGQTGTPTGRRLGANELALSAGYGRTVGPVALGVGATWLTQSIAGEQGHALAMDAGVLARLPRGATVAAVVQGLGPDLTLAGRAAPLPTTWRVAVAAPPVTRGVVTVRAAADAAVGGDDRARGAVAGTVTWQPASTLGLDGRLAWQWQPASDARRPVTAGGAIRLARVAVEYGWEDLGVLGGGTQRLGVRWSR